MICAWLWEEQKAKYIEKIDFEKKKFNLQLLTTFYNAENLTCRPIGMNFLEMERKSHSWSQGIPRDFQGGDDLNIFTMGAFRVWPCAFLRCMHNFRFSVPIRAKQCIELRNVMNLPEKLAKICVVHLLKRLNADSTTSFSVPDSEHQTTAQQTDQFLPLKSEQSFNGHCLVFGGEGWEFDFLARHGRSWWRRWGQW